MPAVAWIPIGCAIAALIGAGTTIVLTAFKARDVKRRAAELAVLPFDPLQLQKSSARITADLQQLPELGFRAGRAIATLSDALDRLSLRRARLALRVALLAISALHR